MQETFNIWIDRLVEGRVQKINGAFDPSFLEIDEKELQFRHSVHVVGEAYLADQHLVVHLKAKTIATMPCAICNKMLDSEVKVDDFYHSEPVAEIAGAIFNFSIPLREALLTELPHYFECNGSNCPDRIELAPYLKSSQKKDNGKTNHFPFADL